IVIIVTILPSAILSTIRPEMLVMIHSAHQNPKSEGTPTDDERNPISGSKSGSLSLHSSFITWYGFTRFANGMNHQPTAQPGENSRFLALSGDRLPNDRCSQ